MISLDKRCMQICNLEGLYFNEAMITKKLKRDYVYNRFM